MTFFYSPTSLSHLSYFESTLVPPVFDSTLSLDDVDHGCKNGVAVAKPPSLSSAKDVFGFAFGWSLMGYEQPASPDEVQIVDEKEASIFVVDRPARLRAILTALEASGATVMSTPEFGSQRNTALQLLKRAHTQRYIDELRSKTAAIGEGEVRPLSPTSPRTYIDRHSFDAAVDAVSEWIRAVDHVMGNANNEKDGAEAERTPVGPAFALVRPPSHHACPSRGMGGCLLNGCAIAANYALEKYSSGGVDATGGAVKRVAILDVDAHHGNGVAACVQDRRRIRYCSIHEEAEDHHHNRRGEARVDDPRGPAAWDVGPNGNLRNVPLRSGTRWDDGYRDALVGAALPFLLGDEAMEEKKPDLLLVACGFDALDEDETSHLRLRPEDYAEMGRELRKAFGNRVVFGLEGGYCWENGALGNAIVQLASAWKEGSS